MEHCVDSRGERTMMRRAFYLVVALGVLLANSIAPARAEDTTYNTFVATTTYQTCYDVSVVAFGTACSMPTDATFERTVTAAPEGSFVNSLHGSGGNLVTANKARATTKHTLSLVLDQALPVLDLTFDYRIDELAVSGASECGLIMSGSKGCTRAGGDTQLTVTPPAGKQICSDGTNSVADYAFGFTEFGTTVKRAKKPGRYSGGFFIKCHNTTITAGSTVSLVFTTRTQVSPTASEEIAKVIGQLLSVRLADQTGAV